MSHQCTIDLVLAEVGNKSHCVPPVVWNTEVDHERAHKGFSVWGTGMCPGGQKGLCCPILWLAVSLLEPQPEFDTCFHILLYPLISCSYAV